jgi:ferredoxin
VTTPAAPSTPSTPSGDKRPKIVLDETRCTGLGICEAMAADYFEVQDDGSLAILKADVCDADLAEVRSAVASCPTEALLLVEE